MSILARLLGDTPVSKFVAENWQRLPLARPGGVGEIAKLAAWEVLVEVVGKAPPSDVIVSKGGAPIPDDRDVTKRFGEGCTIGVRHAERHHEGLEELATRFSSELGAPVNVHIYWTPAGEQGFGWHYDVEDVFILQCQGSKDYLFRKNTVDPMPVLDAMPRDLRFEREIMPVLSTRLVAGDWLYLPAGWWHTAKAGSEASASLSVGLMSPTAIDALDRVRSKLLGQLFWRQRLPLAGTATTKTREQLVLEYRKVFKDLGEEIAHAFSSESLIRSFLDARADGDGT